MQLDMPLGNLLPFGPCFEGGWTWRSPEVPSHLSLLCLYVEKMLLPMCEWRDMGKISISRISSDIILFTELNAYRWDFNYWIILSVVQQNNFSNVSDTFVITFVK